MWHPFFFDSHNSALKEKSSANVTKTIKTKQEVHMQNASRWVLAGVLGTSTAVSQAATLEERMAAFEAVPALLKGVQPQPNSNPRRSPGSCSKSNWPTLLCSLRRLLWHPLWRPDRRLPWMSAWQNSKPAN
ncbi:Sucrose porin [Pseudomonas syringae pv. coriandricola]|uniref:Sucrose porin n=1 Tax=Pseudomonas syringae pv. coriandricola TaxID=264453 RepID=A0A3M4UDA8_9PSED|nr:Sucrose porin [Pseudomonas syringae pv. coriandricola]RMU10637.1 Sucrose porin [Pseudomonas syringae pv. coriandricola]